MIYFDNSATTKPFSSALEAYNKISTEVFGNPNSMHQFGFSASKYLEESRDGILKLLGLTNTHKLVFTSGATESNNLAIKGIAHKYKNRGNKIICSLGEHASVLNAFKELESEGFEVTYLPLNNDGQADLKILEKEMNSNTILVSLMSVNNEVGTYNDLDVISKIVKKFPKCFFHVDATQSMGKDNFNYQNIDAISFSSHKLGGFKGNGCLIFKKSLILEPLQNGGGQEFGFRSGTVNVAGAYSTYVALKEEYQNIKTNYQKVEELRSHLVSKLPMDQVTLNTPLKCSTPYILNFSFLKKKASVILEALSSRDICVSSVSACSSKEEVSSYVLEAMGKDKNMSSNSMRISFSSSNTKEEVDEFIKVLTEILGEVRDR